MSTTSILTISHVSKNFQVGDQTLPILKDISLEVALGDFVVIFGPSGCGKSTLLHIMLGLEVPTGGEVVFFGESIYTLSGEDERSNFRKKHIGMIYQQPNWIKSMNVAENVAFPLMLLGMEKEIAIEKAVSLLSVVNLQEWATHIPTELSGGQQQRVALVRALINNPEILIADEPTGNLDFKAGQDVMELLSKMNKEQGKTVVMVTHDLEYLRFAHHAIQMLDGQIIKVYDEAAIKTLQKSLNFKRAPVELDKKVVKGKVGPQSSNHAQAAASVTI